MINVQMIKKGSTSWTLTEFKTLHASKDIIKKVKRQPTEL
jgi:hypothetical protein